MHPWEVIIIMIHSIWCHACAFLRILKTECSRQLTGMEKSTQVLRIMVQTGGVQWPNWMVDYTLGLVTHIHNLFYARRKAIFMPVIDIKAFFHSCVFPICWAYCLSSPVMLGGSSPRKGEESSTPLRKVLFFCIPHRLHIKWPCGYIAGAMLEYAVVLLWLIFFTCRKKVGMGKGIVWSLLNSYPDTAGERVTSENSGSTVLHFPFNLLVHYSCSETGSYR